LIAKGDLERVRLYAEETLARGTGSEQLSGNGFVTESPLSGPLPDPDLLTEFVRLYRLMKNRPERVRVLKQALNSFPNHHGLIFERSLVQIEGNRYESGIQDLERLLREGQTSAEIHYNLGVAYVGTGDIPRAIAEFRSSLVLDPASADTNHALGLALIHGERYREAVDFLERARELLPSTISIRLDLASAFRFSGAPEEALRECAVARHLNPNVTRTGIEEALVYQVLGQYSEALTCLDTVLLSSPKLHRARKLKAELLTEINRYEEAAEEWRRLVQESPDDPYLHANLGESLKRAGNAHEALTWLENAARSAPNSTVIQVAFAREALSQNRLDLVQEVVDQAYPHATTIESRLQFIEIRLLLTLLSEKWITLIPILADLQHLLTEHPSVLPLDKEAQLDGDTILKLGLSKDAARIHSALLDLFDKAITINDFEELVTRTMRALLPLRPVTKPIPSESIEEHSEAAPLAVSVEVPSPPLSSLSEVTGERADGSPLQLVGLESVSTTSEMVDQPTAPLHEESSPAPKRHHRKRDSHHPRKHRETE
jgi:tetratricopeptide (TPR) repeat protein